MDGTLKDTLPEDALLSIHYNDRRSNVQTWRIYYTDGRLMIYDGQTWRLETTFEASQMARIRPILAECGLPEAEDLHPGPDTHDTADYVWRWRDVDGKVHQVANHAYPAQEHPAQQCALDRLLDLEGFEE